MCHFYFESYIYKNKYWKYIHENQITSRFVEKFVTGHVNTSVKSWIIEEMEKNSTNLNSKRTAELNSHNKKF